jgi:hypothetical protein
MIRRLVIFTMLLAAHLPCYPQDIHPDRIVREGRVYTYMKDGIRHFSSTAPTSGGYRAVPYYLIETGSSYRINGVPCESDCEAEARGYHGARENEIGDLMHCPFEPKAEAIGCGVWVLGHGSKSVD